MMDLTETFSTTLAFFGLPGGAEWIIILFLGLLIFGRRLPEIGRSAGRSIVEFKKGIKGIEEEVNTASREGNESSHSLADDPSRRGDLPSSSIGGERSPMDSSAAERGRSSI
jgi:sec-independent protein translocase protein TatA